MAKYERILVATDLSEQANRALAEAVSIARRHEAELHVVSVDLIAQPSIAGFVGRQKTSTVSASTVHSASWLMVLTSAPSRSGSALRPRASQQVPQSLT